MRLLAARFAMVLMCIGWFGRDGRAEALAVQTVEFEAPSVGRTMKYNVCLPADYESSDERYPVLYLLHGLTSSYQAWARLGAPHYAQFYDLIVVMPDAGNSWYVNWAESDGGQKNDWEDYLIEDVIGHVDANYRTIASREGRAINGLSMGGYGAITLGLRHPEMFCSIGSQSGALGFVERYRERIRRGEPVSRGGGSNGRASERLDPTIEIEGFTTQAERSPLGAIFLTVDDCDRYDPFALVENLDPETIPHITLDCGTEDGLVFTNREFAEQLRKRKIAHTYSESEGGHRPDYWLREVGHAMAVQYHILQRNLGPQRLRLRRIDEPDESNDRREEHSSHEAETGAAPAYTQKLEGPNQARFKNANAFPLTIALRRGDAGVDVIVPPNGSAAAGLPDGEFDLYFQPPGSDTFFRGNPLKLEGGGVEIEIGKIE